jgi:hypothetical protein
MRDCSRDRFLPRREHGKIKHMRVKAQWFKEDKARTPEAAAGVLAFIIWRAGINAVKQMREADFDIDAGPPYFAFMREVLVFMAMVADRIAYDQLDGEARSRFTTEVAMRVADILEENESRLLGPAIERSYRAAFIDLYNMRATDYATFGFDAEGPDFAFLRYLGACITALVPPKDQIWAMDQMVAIEGPDAVESIRKGMRGMFAPPSERPTRRRTVSGD